MWTNCSALTDFGGQGKGIREVYTAAPHVGQQESCRPDFVRVPVVLLISRPVGTL